MLIFLLGRYFYFTFGMESIHKCEQFSRYCAHLGETLNISTANDFTFTESGKLQSLHDSVITCTNSSLNSWTRINFPTCTIAVLWTFDSQKVKFYLHQVCLRTVQSMDKACILINRLILLIWDFPPCYPFSSTKDANIRFSFIFMKANHKNCCCYGVLLRNYHIFWDVKMYFILFLHLIRKHQ